MAGSGVECVGASIRGTSVGYASLAESHGNLGAWRTLERLALRRKRPSRHATAVHCERRRRPGAGADRWGRSRVGPARKTPHTGDLRTLPSSSGGEAKPGTKGEGEHPEHVGLVWCVEPEG